VTRKDFDIGFFVDQNTIKAARKNVSENQNFRLVSDIKWVGSNITMLAIDYFDIDMFVRIKTCQAV
jgi:hypothetical protein